MLPYIAAVHCYALTKNEGICVATPRVKTLRHPSSNEEAPRYQIDLRGLASYRNLTEPMKTDIRRMIDASKNQLFKHHPRDYGLQVLKQMLPVLIGDPGATAWFGGLSMEKGSSKISESSKGSSLDIGVGSSSHQGKNFQYDTDNVSDLNPQLAKPTKRRQRNRGRNTKVRTVFL
jgi:hypothetical protein